MSSIVHSNVPVKGSIVINPKTQRPVKVGGATWRRLVKEGILNGNYQDPKHLANIEDVEKVEEQIKKVNKTLPPGAHAVRGRGKYKGKLVKRNKQLQPEQMAKMLSKIVNNNISKLSEAEDFGAELEKLLLDEIPPKPKLIRQTGATNYRLEDPSEYDSGDVSDSEYETDNESDTEYW